jgi:hypothetical protein
MWCWSTLGAGPIPRRRDFLGQGRFEPRKRKTMVGTSLGMGSQENRSEGARAGPQGLIGLVWLEHAPPRGQDRLLVEVTGFCPPWPVH